MAYCRNCGSELSDANKFCTNCGTPADQAAPAATPPPPVRKSNKGLWIGLAVLVLIVAVACVLVFVVFHDQLFGGEDAADTGPEKAVQTFFTAMENKDADALFSLIDPASYQQDLAMGLTVGQLKNQLAMLVFSSYDSMKFSGLKMETSQRGLRSATVSVTAGQVTIVADGESETLDVVDADVPVELELFRKGGKWYLDFDAM